MTHVSHARPLALFLLLLLVAGARVAVSLHDQIPPFSSTAVVTPVRLIVPRLHIDAPIIPVGLTPDGGMDVPKKAADVGWFSLGTKPGDMGNSVLAGHVDTAQEPRGVFYDLRLLTLGDEVLVADADGKTVQFRVQKTHVYPVDQSPLQEIFGSSSGAFLRLITCDGTWMGPTSGYNQRLVVTAEKVGVDISSIPRT